jgi:hypothetical protein
MVEKVSWDVQSFIPAKHEMVLPNAESSTFM